MTQETQKIQHLMFVVGKTVSLIGVERLTQHLINMQTLDTDLNEEKINLANIVIDITCSNFNIKRNEFFARKTKNYRFNAQGIVAYILHNNFNFNFFDIQFILKKSKSSVSIAKFAIESLDKNHPQDKKIAEKLEQIIKEINQLTNTNGSN